MSAVNEGIVRTQAKIAVADDDAPAPARARPKIAAADDDAPAPARARPKIAAADDDAPAPSRARPTSEKHVDAADGATLRGSRVAPARGTGGAGSRRENSNIEYVRLDYDAMSYDDFLNLLKSKSRDATISQKQRFDEIETERLARVDVEAFNDGQGGYPYKVLLERAMDEIRRRNGGDANMDQQRHELPRPRVERYGSRKTAIINFGKICEALNRSIKDVQDFFVRHLGVETSLGSNDCLILKLQNAREANIEHTIDKYIEDFVMCNGCHSLNTEIRPDQNRLHMLQCLKCHAHRFITLSGSQGYMATTQNRARTRAKNILR